MNCPKCRGASLKSLIPYSSEPPYRCHVCGGYWVNLEMAVRLPELAAQDEPQPEEENRDAKAGLCPHGHGILRRARVELDDRFYLDRCGTCAGVWFDQGEWERLATANLLGNLGQLWTQAWQRQQQAHAAETSTLQRAEQRFGPALTQSLLALAAELRDEPLRSEAIAFLQERSRRRTISSAT